jgi:phospholipase C
MKLTRRSAIKGLGATALTPLAKACAPGGAPAVPASVADRIDTVVVVMMENRSYDHYFGARSLLDGLDGDGLAPGMSNARSDGTVIEPYRESAFCIPDPPHGWGSCHDQFSDGSNAGFVSEHERRHGVEEAARVMGYFTRDELPTSWALADHYASCDAWFSSVMGPTWPNRYYSMLGTSAGKTSNEPIAEELPTVFERVYRAGKSFGLYFGNISFAALSPRHYLEDPEFQYMEKFFEDAAAGTLPNLSWIDPIYGRNDDHPPAHPLAGQVLLQSIYRAMASSPQWERSLLVITYDEHGGFYDHVPPPTTDDDHATEGFDQLGFRVPSLVVGPYVQPGVVSSTVYDHTSIYRSLAEMWQLDGLTARDRAANSFLDVLDASRVESGEAFAPVELDPVEADEGEIYGPGCVTDLSTVGFSLAPGVTGTTGQLELESLFMQRYAGHPKNRLHQTDEVYRAFNAIAEDLGALKLKT